MTAVAGNIYVLYFGRQTAKGVPQTTPQYALKLTGGDLSVDRTEVELQETDSSRQQSDTIVTAAVITGSPDMYVRPDDFGLLAYGLLGTNADSGTAPNYIHTASMLNSGALPYFTIYKQVGANVLVDRYDDCRILGCKLKGQAGQPITATWDITGLTPNFGQTAPVTSVVTQTPLVYPQLTVQKAGVVPATVESFELDITNNADVIQADGSIAPKDVIPGKLGISGTFTMLFESDADYRSFHTGSPTGTTLSTAQFAERLELNMFVNTNLGIDIVMAKVNYTAYPVNPDASGKPIRVAVGFRTKPDSTTPSNYLSIVTRNAVASY